MICFLAAAMFAAPTPHGDIHYGLIFPPKQLHSHGSCIVQCPNGDILACWYQGSGERNADDVRILGARLSSRSTAGPPLGREGQWSAPYVMADTPGFPDCNPCMTVDPRGRLWLFWPTILDNTWESALLQMKVSANYQRPGAPVWEREGVVLLKPGKEFQDAVDRDLDRQWAQYRAGASAGDREKLDAYLAQRKKDARIKLKVRLGWMPRAHPFILDGKRLIVPLYSDGFDFSLMAITDDWGQTWKVSEPLVGPGNVQPTLAKRRDGTLVAYFRDNGPPPQRILTSQSADGGLTWSLARDTELPNPGSGLDVCVLRDGSWLLAYNDTEDGRHSLAVSLSYDEGRTWPVTRHLEHDAPGPDAGSYAYPSVIEARDGTIWVSYSWSGNRAARQRLGAGESIMVAHFNRAWLEQATR
ncbi:MAG: sialidase family protein [Chthonomonadales bacterium]